MNHYILMKFLKAEVLIVGLKAQYVMLKAEDLQKLMRPVTCKF